MNNNNNKATQNDVKEWVLGTDGTFHVRDAMRELKLDRAEEGKLRTYLSRLVPATLERVGGKMGYYRLIQKQWEDIDVFGDFQFYDFKWPVSLHKVTRVGRGGLVVIAGEKGTGKTALLLKSAFMNADKYDIWVYDSESGPDLLSERIFTMYPDLKPPLPFHLQRFEGYPEDMVKAHPDSIIMLDYIEVPDEAYKVAGILKRISDIGGSGMRIVALQKPQGRDIAFGGTQTLNKPQLYLALSRKENNHTELKVVASKSRPNPLIDPTNKTWTYKLVDKGTKFTDINPSDWEEEIPF